MQHRAWDRAGLVRPRGNDAARSAPEDDRITGRRKRPRLVRYPAPPAREDGAAVVEFALVLALISVVAYGVIQFGVAFHRYQGMQAAAREGARFGSQSQATIGGIQNQVKTALSSVIDTGSGNYVDPCPSSPSTLSQGTFCINVSQRNTPSTVIPTLLTTSGYSPSTQPCNLGHNRSVIVNVYHKMPITVPLWAVGSINANTGGEFRCET